MLHPSGYKASWAADLKKEPARIPCPQSNADFQAFAHAGRELAELHLAYETIAPFPRIQEVHTDRSRENRPDYYRVQKMALDPEKGELVFNANVTLQGIPPAAFNYQIGQYNALRWLVERYQVKTDPESGIVNDPNDWAALPGLRENFTNRPKASTIATILVVSPPRLRPTAWAERDPSRERPLLERRRRAGGL